MSDPLPEPPYMYDDERLMYDEQCLFYDGAGYDDVCLAGPTTVVVRPFGGVGGKRRRVVPNKEYPYLNIFIQTQLLQVNEELIVEPPKIIRFTGEDAPISIFINQVQLDPRFPYVSGEIKKLLEKDPDINASIEFLEKIQEKTDDEIIAQNLKSNLTDVEVKIIEPFSKITVKVDLVQEEKEVSMTVALIKKGEYE